MIRFHFMQISDVYMGMGQDAFAQLIRGISIGKLKVYQIYEGFKVRAHLTKVNTESLRKAVPKLWERIAGGDDEIGPGGTGSEYTRGSDNHGDVADCVVT